MNGFFLFLLFFFMMDVITDLVVTVLYLSSWPELLTGFPNTTECLELQTIGCSINEMSRVIPFVYRYVSIATLLSLTPAWPWYKQKSKQT
jgi:hypothetical protein